MANDNNSNRRGISGGAIVLIVLILSVCTICSLCMISMMFFSSLGEATSSSTSSVRSTSSNRNNVVVAGNENSSNEFLSIYITGPIYTNSDTQDIGGLFGTSSVTYGYDVKSQLIDAADNGNYKGIIFEIDSPGGTIAGSNAISDGVAYYREKTGNPVVAFCSGVCASGSYWAAAAADYIVADTGSLTGSIGVIFGPFQYFDTVLSEGSDLFGRVITQNGIETRYFTAGTYKDSGSPYRRLSQEEINVYQEGINSEYVNFINYVAARRNITPNNVRQDIKALVYSNSQAESLNLIDETGNREDAYAILAERAGLSENEYRIVRSSRTTDFFSSLFGINYNAQKDSESVRTDLENQRALTTFDLQPLYYYGAE